MADAKPKNVTMIAIDASPQAQDAFDWYYDYLHKPDNVVYLVHVPEGPTLTMSQGIPLNAGEIQKMIDKEKTETKTLQDKYLNKLAEKQKEAIYKTVYGKAGEALVKSAQDLQATMIVMGTRGQGKVRRTLLGSVSDYLVHHAHCPVAVCRKSST